MLPPLPPALSAVVAEALSAPRAMDLGALQRMAHQDLSSLRAHAYQDLPKLRAALIEFDALPVYLPYRAKVAAILAHVCVQSSLGDVGHENLDRAYALSQIAATDPAVSDHWRLQFALLRSHALLDRLRKGEVVDAPRAIIAEFEGYRGLVGAVPAEFRQLARDAIEATISAFTSYAARMENNPAGRAGNKVFLEEMRDRAPAGSASRTRQDGMLIIHNLVRALWQNDLATVPALMQELRTLGEQLPAADPFRHVIERNLHQARLMVSIAEDAPDRAQPWAQVSREKQQELERLGRDLALDEAQRAMCLFALAMIRMHEQTSKSMDEAVALCAKALPMVPTESRERARYLAETGLVRLARWQTFGDPQDHSELHAGIAWLTQAWDRATETGDHQVLTGIARMLSQAYHMDGRLDLARETALTGLRGRVWGAVMQPRAADAHLVARDASDDAYFASSMFLKDSDSENAVLALELGRCLIVHAATQSKDVATRLEQIDEHSLAREWREATERAAVKQIPNALRRRVMSALSGVELTPDGSMAAEFAAAVALIPGPPTEHEIRAALQTLGQDALVYLVPSQADGTGVAAVYPAADHMRWIRLPELKSERLARFEQRLAAGLRDLPPASGVQQGDDPLEEVCDWAWPAAVGPLLGELEAPTDRPLRIVLIPTRELSRVPWHAARRQADGRVRYAVEDAEFSYAASARLFCASAWIGDVPAGDPGLVVSDPDTGVPESALAGARAEAAAIHTCFYPEARFLGRGLDGADSPAGRGRPEEVRGWLEGPRAGAMLHLACHATVSKPAGAQETSFLLLADGRRLSAEELVDALGTSGSPGLSLVVLAACSSGQSGRGYDEAFSLATAFLVRETRSVISTLWSVSDEHTPALMFMFHHYLRVAGLRPSAALRAAQLWMIRGGDLPDTAPAGLRAGSAARSPSGLAVWAAFVHFGR
jgi:CHAT domain